MISRMHRARKARKGKKECAWEKARVCERETGGMTMNEIDYKGGDTRHVKFRGTSFVR